MALDAVAFDLDYTLAVPRRDRETLLAEAMEATDSPDVSREAYLEAHGDNLTERTREPIFRTLFEAAGSDADAATAATAYRNLVTDSLVPVAGVEEMLDGLQRDYRVGLLTNGPAVAQRDKLDALGWVDAFDVALVTGELDAGKPDPGAFESLLDALGTDADRTAYVGDDASADVAGAADAGLVAIQVVSGSTEPSPRADAQVDRDSLADDLPPLLAEF